jgi:DNA-3-methyladenine glycosylase
MMNLSRRIVVVKDNEDVTYEALTAMDPQSAARWLLGATLTAGPVSVRLVEVEAYGSDPAGPWPDPAAHSYPGPTKRNSVMFGQAGVVYVYLSYGIHRCMNITVGPVGTAGAVLLRGARVLSGHDEARQRRPTAKNDSDLARGPGNLAACLGVTLGDNGTDTTDGGRFILRPGQADVIESGPRVGVSVAESVPWRFWIPGEPGVSAYRRSPRAPKLDS